MPKTATQVTIQDGQMFLSSSGKRFVFLIAENECSLKSIETGEVFILTEHSNITPSSSLVHKIGEMATGERLKAFTGPKDEVANV